MFFKKKKPNPKPLGVPLGDLHTILLSTTLGSQLGENRLEVTYENLTAVLIVEEPPVKEAHDTNLQAIVTIKTYLPEAFNRFLDVAPVRDSINSMATFAALTQDEKGFYLGSRLTIYEDETGWPVYFPLLLYSLIVTNEIFNHSVRIQLGQDKPIQDQSVWTSADFELTKSYMDQICVCTNGPTGFTAEFGLGNDDICAIAGHKTALWTMSSKDSHPALGGGLFCLLQLPTSFEKEQLLKVLNTLNTAEMAPNDLPPHFGAWTTGQRGDNPAYVAFLPNIMRSEAKNIHVNMSIWAHQRVPISMSTLLSHGFL